MGTIQLSLPHCDPVMRRVVICGKGGSGKDYLRDAIRRDGVLRCDVSVTTRPPRANELDGVAYHFYSDITFDDLKSKGGLYESVVFNSWQYGTLKESWETSDVFIMTPGAIKSMSTEDRTQTHVILLDIPEEVRRNRMAQRMGNADNLTRRLEADNLDFSEFMDYDYCITDPNFDCESVIHKIKQKLIVK